MPRQAVQVHPPPGRCRRGLERVEEAAAAEALERLGSGARGRWRRFGGRAGRPPGRVLLPAWPG